MLCGDFRERWLVEFRQVRQPGERSSPLELTAKELGIGKLLRLEQEDLYRSGPPYSPDADTLFVTYDAPVALGCHLALGWPIPARVLDLHAEFRCVTAGLDVPTGYDLHDALAHFKQAGEGLDALG